MGFDSRSNVRAHHKEVQCIPWLSLGNHPGVFCQAHHALSIEMGVYPVSSAQELKRKELTCTGAQCKEKCGLTSQTQKK